MKGRKADLSVLHCPTNVSGLPWYGVRGLREIGINAKLLTFDSNEYRFEDDICLHLELEGSRWKRALRKVGAFLKSVPRYDVFHFHFSNTLLPRLADLPVLRLLGKKTVMNYWGSDVRIEGIALKMDRNYFLTGGRGERDERIKQRMRAVSRHIRTAVIPNVGLLPYVSSFFERVEVIPAATCVSDFEPEFPDESKQVPVVVHAPTAPQVKGTRFIDEAITELRKRHDFQFVLVKNVPHLEARRVYEQADIVVDQLLLETYGTVAIEAMALGKPVLTHVRDDVAAQWKGLPAVNTNPERIRDDLELLLTDPKLRRELGEKGRQYVERVHDCRAIAGQLVALYESL